MSRDNDPWGNEPRNTDTNDFAAIIEQLKKRFLGGQHNPNQSPNSGSEFPGLPKLPPKAIGAIAAIALAAWLSTGIYVLPEGFNGVELTFGRYSETAKVPGFNYHWPTPIGMVTKVDIGSLKNLSIGTNNSSVEGQMLTSDENIVEVSLSVQYKIANPQKYLFKVREPEKILRESMISSIREVVGGSGVDYILTDGRAEWPQMVRGNLIKTLNGFDVGLNIVRIESGEAKAPEQVQAAFEDAVKAREDGDRYKLQAEAYRNKQVPLARGQATQIIQGAEGDKAEIIAKATGEASRFNAVLQAYRLAPEVTRERMYLDTLQNVYTKVNNIILATDGKAPIVYLSPSTKQPIKIDSEHLPTSTLLTPNTLDINEVNRNGTNIDKQTIIGKPTRRLTR